MRFTLKSLGVTLRSVNTDYFARYARKELGERDLGLLGLVTPSLDVIENMTIQIKNYDISLTALAGEKYPVTTRLREIAGVGLLTSLAFVLTIESPERFAKNRDVSAFLGLVPKRDQSGNLDKELSK